MKKKIMLPLAALLFVAPAVAFAASYHYVSLDGQVKTIEAATPQEALAIAHQNGAAPRSGVKFDAGLMEEGDFAGHAFQYVDRSGAMRTVYAADADAAFLLAFDIAPNSGLVWLGTEQGGAADQSGAAAQAGANGSAAAFSELENGQVVEVDQFGQPVNP